MSKPPTGTVTFLFTDIEGSTKLLHDLGEGYRQVQSDHQRLMREAIAAYGGHEVRTEGDSFFVVFRSAPDAMACAVAAQRALAAHPWSHGEPLRVRMGMHTGEGRLLGRDYLGIDVNRAARIAAAGHGGQVLLSDATRVLVADAVPGGVTLRDLGKHRLKDFDEPRSVHQIVIDGLEAKFPPLKTLEIPSNLPVQLTTFVGRERELGQIGDVLGRRRLVTLTGPGGSGKTRLAIQAASQMMERFPDGVFFVDLSAIRDARLVPSAITLSLDLKERPGRGPWETLKEHFQGRTSLLILDNFEQVIDASDIARAVLETAPKTTVLVTSRVRLDLPGEQDFPVPPLEVPWPEDVGSLAGNESVELFLDRARAVQPSFELTKDNAQAVAAICTRLDGLPLAIELAAAQVRLLAPGELLARLDRRLSTLGTGSRHAPERQRTLRRTIEWSYELLQPEERTVFARLAVFAGGATVAAIEEVCNPMTDLGVTALEVLASLIDKSLVRRVEFPEGSRFSMLETIHEYARDRLEAEFDLEDTSRRHAEFFARDAEKLAAQIRGPGGAALMPAMVRDLDNFRAAMSWSLRMDRADLGLPICTVPWRFFLEAGHLSEWREALQSLLTLPSAAPRDRIRAEAVLALGSLLYWQADYPSSKQKYEEALEMYLEIGDDRGVAEALADLAYVTLAQDDPDAALPFIEKGLDAARRCRDLAREAELAGLFGIAHFQRGEYDAALAALKESMAGFETAPTNAGYWLNETKVRIGSVYRMAGRLDDAEHHFRQALIAYRADADAGLPSAGAVTIQLAGVAAARGDHERSLRLGGFVEAIADRLGGILPPALMRVPDLKATARESLDEATVERLWREGKAMHTDQALSYALGEETP
ncbi:MAG TPA: tetratricopeptide repeat protein [Actinomycetota bacterium]|nr:tetratricopeptide repeat protein [Actinomycetota bacterium]